MTEKKRKKYFNIYVTYRRFASRICEESYIVIGEKRWSNLKPGQKTQSALHKEGTQMVNKHELMPLTSPVTGEYKLKPQWENTTRQPEWLNLRTEIQSLDECAGQC